jgi:hypothetical protein
LLPQLARQQGRQQELLADRVHFFAHNRHDFVDGSLAEEEVGVDSGAQLANVSGANQKFVTGNFGVCRGFTKSGKK